MYTLQVYHIQSTFTSRFAADLPVDLLPMSELTGIWLVQFCDWSSVTVTQSKNMSASTTLSKRKNEASLFLAFAVCSYVVMALVAAIVRRLTLIAILSVSKRNGPQPPPSHIKPITFGNELRTYDMIPLVEQNRQRASVTWQERSQ